tara:strand:+ start:356 stop:1939 length:1584 start_codon:yes stop_codon:yes gene_type:complete
MKVYKSQKGYYYKEINNTKIRISRTQYAKLLKSKVSKTKVSKTKVSKTKVSKTKVSKKKSKGELCTYFYEWYNGNAHCLENFNKKNNHNMVPKNLNLPIYTKTPSNYINIPDNYECVTSVDFLTQKGGYNKEWFEKYYIDAEYRVSNVTVKMKELHNNKKQIFLNLLNFCKRKLINMYNIKKDIVRNNITHKNGFIKKIVLPKNHRVIMMGDIHGSYHTFFRHMLRLERHKIIKYDTRTKEPKLNKQYTLLFLGDIVDRGKHGAEVILFILLLIKNSNDLSVILNRGNHEHAHIYSRDGFKEECEDKEIYDYEYFKDMFTVCPTAVILISSNDRAIFCCHGCVDIDIPLKNFINSEKGYLILNLIQTTNIMWSDIDTNIKTNQKSLRGSGLKVLSLEKLEEYLERNNINLVFRGHQDSNANTTLAISDKNYVKENSKYDETITDYKFENGINLQAFLESKESPKISRIKKDILKGSLGCVNDKGIMKVYKNGKLKKIHSNVKVFTLSTNNEYLRPEFFNDSLAIMKT